MNKMLKFLERMWLMVAIVCAVIAAYKSIFVGLEDGAYFLMFGVLAVILWRLRRRMRIRMENHQ
jgi:hypothetical protein